MTYWTDHQHGCCATTPPGPGSEACLIPLRSNETPRCVEASKLLIPTETIATRCEWSCADGQTCVRLRGGEQFLRIGVQSIDQERSTRVVLWRWGTRENFLFGYYLQSPPRRLLLFFSFIFCLLSYSHLTV